MTKERKAGPPQIVLDVRRYVAEAVALAERRDFEGAHAKEDDALQLLADGIIEGVDRKWLHQMALETRNLRNKDYPRWSA